MKPLDAALALAAQGIPVFPCRDDKSPACAGGFRAATVDSATLHELFSRPGAALVGVPTGPASGFDALDLDPRHGSDEWFTEHGALLPSTRLHATRSGGRHYLFRHRPGLRCSTGGNGTGPRPGVDVRGDGGYVIHWPSAGVPVLSDAAAAEWPDALLDQLQGPPKPPLAAGTTPSAPPSAEAVVSLLNQLPNPLSTDRDTYTRAMLAAAGCVAALGDDPGGAIENAAIAWAERWEGGAETDERAKWESDWSCRPNVKAGWVTLLGIAGRLIPGFLAPGAGEEFDALPAAPSRELFPAPFRLPDASVIRPREWIYGHHYIRKFISATVAPGGVGKSSNAIVEALDMVTGRGLLSGKPTSRRFRVVYFNGEDPLEETERRVVAACLYYGLSADDLGDRLTIASGRDVAICMATADRGGLVIARAMTDDLARELQSRSADVLILDPFVKTHAVSENDNGAIDAVISQFARIADLANVSVELIHHLRKASGTGQDRVAEDARGAVSLIAAARSVRVLNVMKSDESTALGMSDDQRRRCFRVDDGKANLGPPADRAIWRHLLSVNLPNARPEQGLAHDSVGVVGPWEKPNVESAVTPAIEAEILRRLSAGEGNRVSAQSPLWSGRWVARLLNLPAATSAEKRCVGALLDSLVRRGVLVIENETDAARKQRPVYRPGAQAGDEFVSGKDGNDAAPLLH